MVTVSPVSRHITLTNAANYGWVTTVVLTIVMLFVSQLPLVSQLDSPLSKRAVRLTLPESARGEAVEPSVAVSNSTPPHIVIGAYSPQSIRGYYWSSVDEGRSWTNGELQVQGDHGAVDPNLQFIKDCEVVYLHGDPGEPKRFLALWKKDLRHEGPYWVADGGLGLQRSLDCGKTYQGRKLVSNPSAHLGVDKPWLTVDRHSGSKFVGSIYVFWSVLGDVWDERPDATDINFMFSRDGGTHFSTPKQLRKHGYAVQAAVRSQGLLDVVWTDKRWKNRKIWHMTSQDGGVSFSKPELVISVSGHTVVDLPSLAVSRQDSLLLTWIQTTDSEPRCGRTHSHVYYSVLTNKSWSPPRPLEADLPTSVSTRFPAATATASAFWVLAYRVTKTNTSVVLYRQLFGSTHFVRYATLGTRQFGTANFHPGPMWRDCSEGFTNIFFPGDYVGLAGTDRTLVAAYVLPRDDNGKTPGIRNVYVNVVSTNP